MRGVLGRRQSKSQTAYYVLCIVSIGEHREHEMIITGLVSTTSTFTKLEGLGGMAG